MPAPSPAAKSPRCPKLLRARCVDVVADGVFSTPMGTEGNDIETRCSPHFRSALADRSIPVEQTQVLGRENSELEVATGGRSIQCR